MSFSYYADSLERRSPRRGRLLYKAAQPILANDGWISGASGADSLVFQNIELLKARARDQYANNEFARRVVKLLGDNVVGPAGFKFQSKAIGYDRKPDDVAQQAINRAFERWQRAKFCDLKGRLSFPRMCRLIVESIAYDGEAFVRIHRDGPYHLKLEIIDSKMVDEAYFDDELSGGHYVRFGIEYNAKDQAVAYHIKRFAGRADDYRTDYAITERDRIPADQIIHLYQEEWVGQHRGLPLISTSLQTFGIVGEYEEAALNAAKTGAKSNLFAQAEAGNSHLMFDADGNPVDVEVNIHEQDVTVLPTGFSISNAADPYPAGEFDTFVKRVLRRIFAGAGINYSLAANDLEGVNYSSLKHGRSAELDTFLSLQNWLIESFLTPVFEEWIERQYLFETVKISNRPLNRDLDLYLDHAWHGRRWESLDPAKSASANEKALAQKTTSVSAIIRETTQRDPLEVFKEIAEEREIWDELGLTPEEVIDSLTNQPTNGGNNDNTNQENQNGQSSG